MGSEINLIQWVYGLLTLVLGFAIAQVSKKSTSKLLSKKLSKQYIMIIQKIIFYLIIIIFTIIALQQIGFNLNTLLGAAGVFSVAIGFASKTVIANMISGFFIILERSIEIGDIIKTRNHKGELIEIGMLSITLKKSDSTIVRIPNEVVLKTDVINLSKGDMQKYTFELNVSYETDLELFIKELTLIYNNSILILKTPVPSSKVKNNSETSIIVESSVWCKKTDMSIMRTSMYTEVQKIYQKNKRFIP